MRQFAAILNISRLSADGLMEEQLKILRAIQSKSRYFWQYLTLWMLFGISKPLGVLWAFKWANSEKKFTSAPTDWKAKYIIVILNALSLRKLWELEVWAGLLLHNTPARYGAIQWMLIFVYYWCQKLSPASPHLLLPKLHERKGAKTEKSSSLTFFNYTVSSLEHRLRLLL